MDFKTNLYVLQVIKTIQGEGNTIGMPSMLLRLAGCNCRCPWCDTAWSWNDTRAEEIKPEQFNEWLANLKEECGEVTNLMITGGEPFLYKDNPLFIMMLNDPAFKTIEIETNGSLLDSICIQTLPKKVKLNISPKLDSTWYLKDYGVDYTNIHNVLSDLIRHNNVLFKFVDDTRYFDKMTEFIEKLNVPKERIYIMPLTPSRAVYTREDFLIEVQKSNMKTIKFCLETGYNFSARLHLYLFDDEHEVIK